MVYLQLRVSLAEVEPELIKSIKKGIEESGLTKPKAVIKDKIGLFGQSDIFQGWPLPHKKLAYSIFSLISSPCLVLVCCERLALNCIELSHLYCIVLI